MAETIDAALPLLRRPFSPSAVRAKVQSQDRAKPPNWGQIARYIDARLVSERLNLVAGGRWSYEYAPLDPALRPPVRDGEQAPLHVVCSLTVLGQTHTDVGEGRDPKAAFSDALKRAAVPFGIGRSIYAVPRRFLFAEESRLPPRDKLRRRGERLYLTDANELLLREEYERCSPRWELPPLASRSSTAPTRRKRSRRSRTRWKAKGRLSPTRATRRRAAGCARSQTARRRSPRRRSTSAGG